MKFQVYLITVAYRTKNDCTDAKMYVFNAIFLKHNLFSVFISTLIRRKNGLFTFLTTICENPRL